MPFPERRGGHGGCSPHLCMTTSLRVAAVGDLHCTRASEGLFQPLFAKAAESADVLVLCGDLTDYGTPDEARVLAKELAGMKVPKLAVLGNHDFESNAADEVSRILADAAGVTVLDGTAVEVQGVGFAGAKGFAGGMPSSTSPTGPSPCRRPRSSRAIRTSSRASRAIPASASCSRAAPADRSAGTVATASPWAAGPTRPRAIRSRGGPIARWW
jgi:Calcineurin-like phosphoesterase